MDGEGERVETTRGKVRAGGVPGVEHRPAPSRRVHVGIGALAVSRRPDDVLTAILGSCVGVVMLDHASGVCGLAHVMLPDSRMGRGEELPAKYADLAVPALLAAMRAAGARASRIALALAGGAEIFGLGGAAGGIGTRNVGAVRDGALAVGLRPAREDVGGGGGRLCEVWVGPRQVVVRRPGAAPDELALLTP
jgi:chemotaxis protein CheD